MMINNRPVFLNLFQFRFPIAAIMSVGHRASGVLMVLAFPFLVYILDLSLQGEAGFAAAREILQSLPVRLVLFLLLWALMHHLLAGIRFLLIDFDIGVGREQARLSAWFVMLAAPLLALLVGVLS
ncbi:MAG TPA: succinate dehydrogenase, cytochrome b556 subunit [Sedimenticola thiotaurini]|uniref:Succinate dehydrogenase cytochrome b556 subunit n=1 Tax=Sedimenticola thiotaurini TaxID=1543721 RepID=A0A831RHN3_9GAMM|nr:succinate dehydrogenase, cytochrome b556 subunit [Sedimenticola thiotaurini]